MSRFEDKCVVVTGASRGLGRSIATRFAEEGARVFIGFHARRHEADKTLAAIEEAGGRGHVLPIDVADNDSVKAALAEVNETAGAIDVLVNNAGIANDQMFPMMDHDAWSTVIETNLGGTFNVCRAATRPMLKAGRGVIINVASVAGLHASPGQANYAAAKGGIVAFTKTLAAELAPRGIRVNAVVPGLLTTGMAARLDRRIVEARRAQIPLGRLGDGDEVARAVCFLASDDASYVIGQALVVDGGLTL